MFKFNPEDGLLNTSEFPNKPSTGTIARNQFMKLFNQIRDYINNLESTGIKANGGNADTVGNKAASSFATSDHNHDTVYSNSSHNHDSSYSNVNHNHDSSYAPSTHYHGQYVDRYTPRFRFSGRMQPNQYLFCYHGLNTTEPLFTMLTTVGNVNPTIGIEDSNTLKLYTYNTSDCGVELRIW